MISIIVLCNWGNMLLSALMVLVLVEALVYVNMFHVCVDL
jgi:hypothetical protein